MKETINLKKEIELPNNICEVTSISLDNTFKPAKDTIEGVFNVQGTYIDSKINRKEIEFEENIPYANDFLFDIVPDSANVEIKDFTYTINENKINLNIEYEMTFEKDEIEEEIERFENIEEDIKEEIIKESIEEKELEREEDMNIDTNFINYKIHICKEMETIETIAQSYNTNPNTIKEINEIDNIFEGLKIIIPTNENY